MNVRALYTDLVLYALASAVRAVLEIEMNLSDYEFKSELFRRKLAEGQASAEARGLARGEARGESRALLAVLAARGLVISDALRARIVECNDTATLERWISRAATAQTAEEAIDD